MTQSFPFDCVIVTSPDAASAESSNAAIAFLRRYLKETYEQQEIRVVSTFDPFGARCGSGGGTIAALEYASPENSILVLHAGGDSSRCPTQMILGKAWTNLPHPRYRNPTIWLVDQLVNLYSVANFPKGTMIVGATDCLLKFFDNDGNLPACIAEYSTDAVIGVAVPAPLTTAKNHGVYIMPEPSGNKSDHALRTESPLEVWQKPSIEQLMSIKEASIEGPAGDRRAWIDTGLVIFLPGAVTTLCKLAETSLSLCTRKGLENLFHKEQPKSQSLQEFAHANALKVDLYTDILHNLSWPGRPRNKSGEGSSFKVMFRDMPLRVLLAPDGAFLHLGTSSELLSFMTHSVYPELKNQNDLPSDLSHFSFFQSSFQCLEFPKKSKSIALQSRFPTKTDIGNGSLVEYCDFAKYETVSIGDNCIISGWKQAAEATSSLTIPSNLCTQQLTLDSGETVFMVYGTNDSVKSPRDNSTLYGVSVADFQRLSAISPDEWGWPRGTPMWTAPIHPRVSAGTSFQAIFGWLNHIKDGTEESISENESFKMWLGSPRVSLKELHALADADAEWTFRRDLELSILHKQQIEFIPNLQRVLRQRSHDEVCDIQWLYELEDEDKAVVELHKILAALEDIMVIEIENDNYDICGRALMLASVLASEFVAASNGSKKRKYDQFGLSVTRGVMQSSLMQKDPKKFPMEALSSIREERRTCESTSQISFLNEYAEVLEILALKMNEVCVSLGFQGMADEESEDWTRRREKPSFGATMIAVSPVRVDIAGGWSDTPPISYEFGGSVTGMAVLVDGNLPLSCRCGATIRETGLLLRSENRDLGSGSLISFVEVEILDAQQFCDFRNPRAECALIKAALMVLKFAKERDLQSGVGIQNLVNSFCSSTENARLEIVTTSLLPQGSGMGTSSILAGCILAAVAKCVGIGKLNEQQMVNAVLMVEQLLSSGGGWQDQANGIVPGIKTLRSNPTELPMSVSIEKLEVGSNIISELDKRLVLVFTGKTRLAKGILQKVLRRWARRESNVLDTVKGLVEGSERARSVLLDGKLDELGHVLSTYAELKVKMAGEDAGVEPEVVRNLVQWLKKEGTISGHSLCGAGGGGFLVMLASPAFDKDAIKSLVDEFLLSHYEADLSLLTWHDCKISQTGMEVFNLGKENLPPTAFDIGWHKLGPRNAGD